MLDSTYRDGRHRVVELVSTLEAAQLQQRVPATPDWTARHVAERRDHTVPALLAEWHEVGPVVDASLVGQQFTGPGLAPDLICHEADLREALGVPPVHRAHWHDQFLPKMMALLTSLLRPLTEIVIQDDCGCQWRCGAGEITDVLQVDGYELLRAMFSRRARSQIAAWPWPRLPSAQMIDSFGVFGPRDDPGVVGVAVRDPDPGA